MAEKKKVEFLGDSLAEIKNFPADARRDAGYQIGRVQDGLMPEDFKVMKTGDRDKNHGRRRRFQSFLRGK